MKLGLSVMVRMECQKILKQSYPHRPNRQVLDMLVEDI